MLCRAVAPDNVKAVEEVHEVDAHSLFWTLRHNWCLGHAEVLLRTGLNLAAETTPPIQTVPHATCSALTTEI